MRGGRGRSAPRGAIAPAAQGGRAAGGVVGVFFAGVEGGAGVYFMGCRLFIIVSVAAVLRGPARRGYRRDPGHKPGGGLATPGSGHRHDCADGIALTHSMFAESGQATRGEGEDLGRESRDTEKQGAAPASGR